MTNTPSEETLNKKLSDIQKKLDAPKGQFNSFGNYKYRSCEDILGAVKPLLGDLVLTLSDEMVQLGDRYYVKATATLTDGQGSISVSAYARESLDKKGMDSSQITGATSSYARKYALSGLFAIDDTKDADTMDNTTTKSKQVMDEHTEKNLDASLNGDVPETGWCSIHNVKMERRIGRTSGKPFLGHHDDNGKFGICFGLPQK